jgi:DNA ligase-1
MTNLPILYSKTSTGAIQTWQIELDQHRYRTISGQLNGKQVTSEWTECEGKNLGRSNETSAVKQAQKDAKAIWKDKIKRKGYWEDINDVDKKTFIEPMLAKKFVDRLDKVTYPVMVDRKYNGMRCLDGVGGQFSRWGTSIISAPHTHKAIEDAGIFEQFPEIVIDGELYNHAYRFQLNELISLVRKTKDVTPEELAKSEELVKYYVYDGYNFSVNGVEIPSTTKCSLRRAALAELFAPIPEIEVVEFGWANTEAEVWEIYNQYIEDGYEGAIVRQDAEYQNKRSSNLLKVKPTDDAEFRVIDVIEGIGNRSGMAGKVIVENHDGRPFGCGMKGTREQFIKVLMNKKDYIGKKVTIYYNGLTGKGIPNFAQFDCDNYDKGDRS